MKYYYRISNFPQCQKYIRVTYGHMESGRCATVITIASIVHSKILDMNPTLVRSFSRSATKMAAMNESATRSAATNWAINLLGVSAVLGAGTAMVAWKNNENNSRIRNIFKNERALTRASHN